jgi:hypothetical protein
MRMCWICDPGTRSLQSAGEPLLQPAVARDVIDHRSRRFAVASPPGPACTSHSMST